MLAVDVNADGLDDSLAEEVAAAGGTIATLTASIAERAASASPRSTRASRSSGGSTCSATSPVCRAAHFAELRRGDYRQMFAVNVDGPYFLSQAALPHLIESRGNIVNIASNAGLMGTAYTVAYSMTKGAIVQLTAVARDGGPEAQGARANAIAPGGVVTGLTNSFHIPDGVDIDLMTPYMGFRGDGRARRHRLAVRLRRVRRRPQHARQHPVDRHRHHLRLNAAPAAPHLRSHAPIRSGGRPRRRGGRTRGTIDGGHRARGDDGGRDAQLQCCGDGPRRHGTTTEQTRRPWSAGSPRPCPRAATRGRVAERAGVQRHVQRDRPVRRELGDRRGRARSTSSSPASPPRSPRCRCSRTTTWTPSSRSWPRCASCPTCRCPEVHWLEEDPAGDRRAVLHHEPRRGRSCRPT